MFYLSIDTETTGLDPKTCQLLEFSAVVEQSHNIRPLDELPRFNAMFKHATITGDQYALNLNANLIHNIKEGNGNIYTLADAGEYDRFYDDFHKFLNTYYFVEENKQKSVLLAGKNVIAFDIPFINKTLMLFAKNVIYPYQVKVMHRAIDPAILYTNFAKDVALPSSDECIRRYKKYFDDDSIDLLQRHTATDDALIVIQLLRPFYSVFKEEEMREVA